MSRASDSSSSGPKGRGGAAYPSGTPPYGTSPGGDPAAASAAQSGKAGAKPGEPKTETTLTTRIRINIPGSRPIPPVVMRTPVGEDAEAGQDAAAASPDAPAAPSAPGGDHGGRKQSLPTRPKPAPRAPGTPPPGAVGYGADGEATGDKTSDWFAPRKSGAPAAPPAARRQAAAQAAAKQPPLPRRGAPGRPAGTERPAAQGGSPAAPRGGSPRAGAPRWERDPAVGGAVPQAQMPAAGPVSADSSLAGTGPWAGDGSATGAMPQVSLPGDPSATAATPWPAEQNVPGAGPVPGDPSVTGATPWPGDMAQGSAPGAAPWQGDPSTTASMPQAFAPGDPQTTGATPWPADPSTTGAVPQPPVPGGTPGGEVPWPGGGGQAPGTARRKGKAAGGRQAPGGAAFAPGRTDTPRQGVPAVGGDAPAPQGNAGGKGKKKGGPKAPAPAAGQTLVSGVPPVPPAAGQGPKSSVDSGAPRVPVPKPKPAPAVPKPPAAPAAKGAAKGAAKSAPKKKGRSKLVLLGGGLVALVGVAYGAGLLLDHADVPNGTTVLGVDIGGKSKDEAVKKLDAALGDRASAPLKLSVGGKTAELKPDVAGLSIDTQATVRAAAGRDYNPVTVLGSLVGGTRKAEPTVNVDEEKIAAALKTVAGQTGASKDGTIKFEPGKAVPVYGQPYEGLDVDKSVKAVSQAYRDRAASGQDKPVELTSSAQQPRVSKAEVDRMMKDFAEPAMSGLVTVQTDPAHKINFGPDRSLPKILSVKEVGGKLVENYDLDAIKELYGKAFDGVLIQRGDGTKKPVQPTDVAGALGKALRGKTPAERIATIPLS
ncbi:hypothetical protein [Streptomyces sp. DSM 41493]